MLDVVKELRQETSVEFLELQVGRSASKPLRGEAKEKPEGVAVASNGVRAGAKLSRQPIREEPLEKWREACGGHGITCLR